MGIEHQIHADFGWTVTVAKIDWFYDECFFQVSIQLIDKKMSVCRI
jgi:hypothetical protein